MKFCSKCGNEVKEEQLYCNACGNPLRREGDDNTEAVEETSLVATTPEPALIPVATPISEENPTSTSKLSKKSKIVILVATILVIAIFSAIQVGNYLSDPKKLITRFENDVASNNTSDLASILYCSDARLKVDSKSIAPLEAYFKSNPSYFDKVLQNLNNDALSPREISSLNLTSSNTLTLSIVGKNLLIFPNYKINIRPSYVDISAIVKDVTYSINNIQIDKSNTDNSTQEFGPYIPGNYSILANYQGKYVTLSKPYSVDLVSTANGIAKLTVFDDMCYLNISSDYPDAEVYVNGLDAEVKVKDATTFGPVDSSAKIFATYEKDGKKLKSREYSASSGDANLYLSFQDSDNAVSNIENQLQDLLQNYASYFTQAVNSNNISLIVPYVASGSDLYKAQQSYIPNTYAAGTKEYIVSTKITNYTISDDNKSGTITTSEVYDIVSKDGNSSTKTFNYLYKFIYNSSTYTYQLTSINQAK